MVCVLRADDDNRRQQAPFVNPLHEQSKRQAEQAYTDGDFDKVPPLLDTVLRQNPRDDVALYLRGSARIELGLVRGTTTLVREGISDCRQAILLDTRQQSMYYLPYLYGMTNLSALENRPQHAEVSVQVSTQALGKTGLKPEDRANLLYQRALAHQTLNKLDLAATDYDAAIKLQASHLGARLALAEVYALAGKSAQAKTAYDEAASAFPNSAVVFNNRGRFLQQDGKLDAAIVDFTRALEEEPNYYTAFANRAYCLAELGNFAAAELDYTQSLKQNPNQPTIHHLRAEARLAQGKAKAAMEDYQRMIALDPKNAVAVSELGFAQFFGGDPQAAANSFQRAVQMDSNLRYVDSWRYLALTAAGQTPAAQALLTVSRNKAVGDRDWIDLLVLYQGGVVDVDELRKGLSSEAEMKAMQQCELEFFVGRRLLADGKAEEAAERFRAAIETGLTHLSAFKGARFAVGDFGAATAANPE